MLSAIAHDGHFSRNRLGIGINLKFRSKREGAQFRFGEFQVVLLLELMVGELVPRSHPKAIAPTLRADQIDSSNLRFFSAVLCVGRDHNESPWARAIRPLPL